MNPLFSVNDPGHSYALANMEKGTQPLVFIRKKVTTGSTTLVTANDGTTNEAVLAMLIDRLEWLNAQMPSDHNEEALTHIEAALECLHARTDDRKKRGVEGTSAE